MPSGNLPAIRPSNLFTYLVEGWKEEAGILVERELDCAISTPTAELVAAEEMASTAQYLCTIRDDLYLVCWQFYVAVHPTAVTIIGCVNSFLPPKVELSNL